jgi:glycosyltransferase involved in cell wall biosynthesis
MRVALLAYEGPHDSPLGLRLVQQLAFFRERGADVRLFVECLRGLHPELAPGVCACPGGHVDAEGWRFLTSADLVIAVHDRPCALPHVLPRLAGGRPRIVLDYHDPVPDSEEAPGTAGESRAMAWSADAVFVPSRFSELDLFRATGFPPDRVFRVGIPGEGTATSPGPAVRPLSEQLGLGQGCVLLSAGSPTAREAAVLVEALARLRERRPRVHVVWVGASARLAHDCKDLAQQQGVADRLHFLGRQDPDRRREAYRSASALVMTSAGESSGRLALEALACALPVVAVRAAGVPVLLGDAGLSFAPGDAEDLARQVERVLTPAGPADAVAAGAAAPLRIAVVSLRYGTDFAGGAEASLRTVAEVLHRQGHAVEVFTTCTRSAAHWQNVLRAGTTPEAGVPVHRFPVDPYDRERHLESVRALLECRGRVPAEVEEEYLRHTVYSSGLIAALRRRIDSLDAVIVGPYLFGLTFAVATTFPEKTLVLPCFHDEALARLRAWRMYERAGGLLFHSPEEREFTQAELGLNHPNSVDIGVYLPGAPEFGRPPAGPGLPGAGRYVAYCGRYSEEKGLTRLLDYARTYQRLHPGRFRFVFMGEGNITIPSEEWACDLGFVSPERKRQVLAGADALAQLSHNESLSLVALEAWALGVPVLADQACRVLAGQLRRSGGGCAVGDFAGFCRALDDLWQDPPAWRQKGQHGQEYVRRHYGCAEAYAGRLLQAVTVLRRPLWQLLRDAGPRRAAAVSAGWREGFGAAVDELLHGEPRLYREQLEVRPQHLSCTAAADVRHCLLPVRVANGGTHLAAAEGPGRFILRAQAVDAGGLAAASAGEAALPRSLPPGQDQAAVIPVPLPAAPGRYQVQVWAERADRDRAGAPQPARWATELVVVSEGAGAPLLCTSALELVRAELAVAEQRRRLPRDYADVTAGWFARWKRWIKRKLLNNFKRAYVDVLSGQQSQVNERLLTACRQLVESCATLDHAVRLLQDRLSRLDAGGRVPEAPQAGGGASARGAAGAELPLPPVRD